MSLRKKQKEIQRLLTAFESEANKFHEISLSTYFITQDGPNSTRQFEYPNHAIMLWQYYGNLGGGEQSLQNFMDNLEDSDLKWGMRGAKISFFAVVEGLSCNLFVRMAKRAGSLFNKKDASLIHSMLTDEFMQRIKNQTNENKPVFTSNSNLLALWLNFLLYHLSKSNPGREKFERIEPDPFTLSMLALERLAEIPKIIKSDRSVADVEKIKFRVAVSFPGTLRSFVSDVVQFIRPQLAADSVFYDFDYQAQLARPDLDVLLQDIYRNRSDLLVVFLNQSYAERDWCGIEWRAVRDIIKNREGKRVMFIRFDDVYIDGIFSIDGYIDGRITKPQKVAEYILERVELLPPE